MILKEFEQITELDLKNLIENKIAEKKTIEYKLMLPSDQEKSKQEFLADVSSFANASGGDIIYGIKEDNSFPIELAGLDLENVDEAIRRLEDMMRSGISPRINEHIHSILLNNSKNVLIIRVPKSWNNPHRVIYGGHDKFYSRSTNGKYQMDVAELRIAFTLSETIIQKIRQFRENRISNIIANETPLPFMEGAKIILHIIPLTSLNTLKQYDINKIATKPGMMSPMYCSQFNHRYNLDGFVTFGMTGEKCDTYVQLFRNGIIEAVNGYLLNIKDHKELFVTAIEENIIKSVTEYLLAIKILNIELPIIVFLTLYGVKGYKIKDKPYMFFSESYEIDRDILTLPEILIDKDNMEIGDACQPCFDAIWNAGGYPGSPNYQNGSRKKI